MTKHEGIAFLALMMLGCLSLAALCLVLQGG